MAKDCWGEKIKGKGKGGKGDGKGKGGKGKGPKFEGYCNYCNKYGHSAKHCWQNPDRINSVEDHTEEPEIEITGLDLGCLECDKFKCSKIPKLINHD